MGERAAVAGGAPALTRPTTNQLAGWEARSGTTVTGSGVSSWLGIVSGVDMTQGSDALRPPLSTTGGYTSLLFDGIAQCLNTTSLTATAGPRTVYAVVNPTDAAADRWVIDSQTGRFLTGRRSGFLSIYDGSYRSSAIASTTGLQQITTQHAGGNFAFWKNGAGGTPVAAGAELPLGGTTRISGLYNNLGAYFKGHLLALYIYSDTRNTAVEAYITQEWGV